MTTLKAAAWEQPDQEYYAETEDYALVGESAKIIRAEIDEANRFVPRPGKEPQNYGDLGRLHQRVPAYDFLTAGNHIIYADVDDSDRFHEQKVKRERSEEQKLDRWVHGDIMSISEKARDAHVALSEYLIEAWKGRVFPDSVEQLDPDDDLKTRGIVDFHNWKGQQLSEIFDEMQLEHAALDPKLINYIVGAGRDHRQELMYIASCQELNPNKRPVMLLISMVDSLQTDTPGTKKGWAIAYDVVAEQIIVKAFRSDAEHHPLTSSWAQPVVDDGVSFQQAPLDFVKNYIEMARGLSGGTPANKRESSNVGQARPLRMVEVEPSLAFRMFVHTSVAKWVIRQWAGLIAYRSSSTEVSDALLKDMQEARSEIKFHLAFIPFSVPSIPETNEAHKKIVVHPFAELEWSLVEMEDYFRSSAIHAKETGEDKIARNVKVLYERMMMLVQAFNLNPRAELGSM